MSHIKIGIIAWLLILPAFVVAQRDAEKRPSPARLAEAKVQGVSIRIDYGSPSVKNREIWGKLVPYGKIWRTGANEATTILTDADILIEGELLKAGRYALFTIPDKDVWTIVINTNADQWGAYKYNQDLDVLRIKVRPQIVDEMQETLLFKFEGSMLTMRWERLVLPLKFSKP
ncbi:MAG: DUF2911 domain-containing protein [Flavobacteriales bacterium]|jgi:hypothetical protein|nr:DUF2911 domain-containing protein [Flavobacteriales bacterium]